MGKILWPMIMRLSAHLLPEHNHMNDSRHKQITSLSPFYMLQQRKDQTQLFFINIKIPFSTFLSRVIFFTRSGLISAHIYV